MTKASLTPKQRASAMADNTPIEWTDATWNPVTGCSVVSPGCTNCYAMKLAGTRMRNHWSRTGLTEPSKAGPVWNGEVRFNEDWLTQPLRWKKPRRIFVAAHGDLFHENIPDEWVDRIFAVMALCPQHIFQVLTKRPDRMRDYMNGVFFDLTGDEPLSRWRAASEHLNWFIDAPGDLPYMGHLWKGSHFPAPNVWLGTSVEDQQRADERIPLLLDTPAALRWVSYEPALGPVDFRRFFRQPASGIYLPAVRGLRIVDSAAGPGGVDWIITGGESGPGARPFDIDWARSTIKQCKEAQVPVFMKQCGASNACPHDKKGGHFECFPPDLRVREFPAIEGAAP